MPAPVVAPLHPVFPDVRRIVVLRGGAIGDLVFALPALAALRAAYPEARLTLLASPVGAALLEHRPGVPVDEVAVLPAAEGVQAGEPDGGRTAAFVEMIRADGVDLAVQLHGGGRHANPFLLALDPRHSVGTATPDATPLGRTLAYDYFQHEVLRWLEVAGLAGARPVDLEPSLAASAAEGETGRALLGEGTVVLLHPGASDPRRRWPADRFGALAAALVEDGARVVVIGDAAEAPIADSVVDAARALLPATRGGAVRSIAGEVDLKGLVGVLAAADLLVADDSGPRHLAQALGTRTVGIFVFGNTINAAPFGRGRHRIRLGRTTACPVCGRDATQVGWTAERCEHDPSYVADVPLAEVLADARDLLRAGD